MAEDLALGEGEDLGRAHREDRDAQALHVLEAAVADLELPSPVPLGRPRLSQRPEQVVVGDLDGAALEHPPGASLPREQVIT